jgi:hypothetical protein
MDSEENRLNLKKFPLERFRHEEVIAWSIGGEPVAQKL